MKWGAIEISCLSLYCEICALIFRPEISVVQPYSYMGLSPLSIKGCFNVGKGKKPAISTLPSSSLCHGKQNGNGGNRVGSHFLSLSKRKRKKKAKDDLEPEGNGSVQ